MTRGSAASSGYARYGFLLAAIVAGLLFVFAHMQGWFTSVTEARAWLSWIVIIEFSTVMLMAVNTAATAITRERDQGTMELLLTTPLTSRYILWGKLRGLVSFTVPLLAIPAATVLAVALVDLLGTTPTPIIYPATVALLPPLLLVYSAFACIMGLHMSLKSKRSMQAILASVGLLTVIGFGLGLCGSKLVGDTGPVGVTLAPLTFVSAIWIVLNPADAAQSMNWGRTSASVASAQLCLLIGVIIAMGLYGAIVAGTYKSMITNFDMIVRKQSR